MKGKILISLAYLAFATLIGIELFRDACRSITRGGADITEDTIEKGIERE